MEGNSRVYGASRREKEIGGRLETIRAVGAVESFWSTLKLELIYRQEFATHAQIRAAVFDYIEAFDNRQRAHSSMAYLSPTAFETQKH